MRHLRQKSVLVGVTGGIAAYKACDLVRRLVKEGARVRVVLTEGGARFVAPLTWATLSGAPVIEDVWQLAAGGEVGHVHVGNRADLIVIAPATANTLARLASGMSDDALATLVLSSRCPVLIAPAMETDMWQQAATRANVATLAARGRFHFIGPEVGALASGKEGEGRMSEPEAIFHRASALLAPQLLAGRKLVVSAGPTREALDPIRYLSNRSSGKMGYAIAEVSALWGAETHLVHGPVALPVPHGVHAHAIESARDMLRALERIVPKSDALIMAAAVADYAPRTRADRKLKKRALGKRPVLALRENPDVVATLARAKGKTLFVGFAAETEELAENALLKLEKKGLDLIVANDVSQPGIGMDADENRIDLYDARGLVSSSERRPKHEIAELILTELHARLVAGSPRRPRSRRSSKGSKSGRGG